MNKYIALLLGIFVIVALTGAGYYLYTINALPFLPNEQTNIVAETPDQTSETPTTVMTNTITFGELNSQTAQEVAAEFYIVMGNTKVGAVAKDTSSLGVFPATSSQIIGTVFLPQTSAVDKIVVTVLYENTNQTIGPIAANVKNDAGTSYAEITLTKSVANWSPGSYKLTAYLPDGRAASRQFTIAE